MVTGCFDSVSDAYVCFTTDDKLKQGFEEPKFVPFQGQVFDLCRPVSCREDNNFHHKAENPWQTMAPHDALHTSNLIASAIYDSIAQ